MKNPGVPYGTAPGFGVCWCAAAPQRENVPMHIFFSGSVLLRYGYLPHILQWLQWLPQCRGRCPLGS